MFAPVCIHLLHLELANLFRNDSKSIYNSRSQNSINIFLQNIFNVELVEFQFYCDFSGRQDLFTTISRKPEYSQCAASQLGSSIAQLSVFGTRGANGEASLRSHSRLVPLLCRIRDATISSYVIHAGARRGAEPERQIRAIRSL